MSVRHHRWCGLTLATNITFPELMVADPASPAPLWRLMQREGRAPRRPGRRWFHRWRFPDGRKWVAFSRDPIGYVLRFPGLADFDVRPAQHEIDCYPAAGAPAHTVRHLALDQVLPLIVGSENSIALHGSVIGTPKGALVFLGQSGLGKSTLAAKLGGRGHAVLSDDCALLSRGSAGFTVVPSYPGVRLNPDSVDATVGALASGAEVAHYSAKRRIAGTGVFAFSEKPVPLSRVYVIASRQRLERAVSITITPCSKRDALYALTDYTFHLDIGYMPRLRETFGLAADLIEAHGVQTLIYPWDLSGTDTLADAVLDDAR